jgi:hypothetical protein
MTSEDWRRWLLSASGGRWPTCVGELMPPGLAACCLVLANDPTAKQPLDAEGHLSLTRLDALVEALGVVESSLWMVAWWDGWKGIREQVEAVFRDRLFMIELPDRTHLACHASLEEVENFSHAQWPFIGPSLLAAADRSVLLAGDVDWAKTYLGFGSRGLRDRVADTLEQQGIAADRACGPRTPLPGFAGGAPL